MASSRCVLLAASVLALATCGARASSFVIVAPPKEAISRSFVVLGEPVAEAGEAPAPLDPATTAALPPRSPLDAPPDFGWGETVEISPSVIAMGAPAMEVAEAAASKAPARPQPWAMPVVIRGGVVGAAAPAPAVAAAPSPEPAPASAPEPAQPIPEEASAGGDEERPAPPAPSDPPPGLPPVLGRPE